MTHQMYYSLLDCRYLPTIVFLKLTRATNYDFWKQINLLNYMCW